MATAQVFSISKDVARGYKVPRGRPVLPNGAGVTAIMGLTNGRGAARRAAKKNCRDEDGKFTSCDYEPNTPSDERADRRRSRKAKSRKRPVSRGRRGRGTSFAAEVARKCRAARDDYAMVRGEFVSCDPGASTFGKRSSHRRRATGVKSKRGGATCWKSPRAKYVAIGARKAADYAYPECFAYPIHGTGPWTKRLIPRAIKWFRVHQDKYAPSVRAKIASRIARAARQVGLSARGLESGRQGRARRNEGASEMIVMEPTANRRRGHGKRRGKASRRHSSRKGLFGHSVTVRSARRNGLFDSGDYTTSSDDVGDDVFSMNRRGRGKKRRGASKRRGSSKRRWGKGRKVARRSLKRGRRSSAKRSWGKKRRGASKRHTGRGRRGGASGLRVYVKNSIPNFTMTPAMRAYAEQARRARGGTMEGMTPAGKQRARNVAAMRHSMIKGYRAAPFGAGLPMRGFQAPWVRQAIASREAAKLQRQMAKQRRLAMAMPAVFGGLRPRDLNAATRDLTRRQVEALFPDYKAFRSWMGTMRHDKKFSRWTRKFGSARRYGKRRGFGRRRFGGKRRGYGKRRWGKSRRGFRARRHGRRGFRRNFLANLPYMSGKEMLVSGIVGVGAFGLIHYGSEYLAGVTGSANSGTVASLALGAALAFGSDSIFDNNAYAKAASIAGFVAMAASAAKVLLPMLWPAAAAAAGLGGVNSVNTRAHYVRNPFGAFQQAAAGFGAYQQALASPFQQAAAGFGEYYGGTGEYVSSDNSLIAVSDFGEYVASGLQVQGYGDYEVMPGYSPSADGFGYVNDGLRPDANLDHEFDIIEAAAGLGASGQIGGASPMTRSDYIPTVQSGYTASADGSPDQGIFDVGGSNGVFG